MKAISTAKRFASLLALLLAITMLFAACGGTEDTGDVSSTESVASTDEDTADASSEETQNNDTQTESTGSKQTNSNGGSTTTSNPGNSGTTATNGFNSSKEASLYNNAPKGSTVHVLMWRDYKKTEKAMVDAFQKKTGITVKTTVTTEQEYATKLVSMVSGGNSPDVVMFQSDDFPGLVTKSLQTLDEKTFQLDSDCWNKTYMDYYKVNGKYFGVAMPGIWSCEDCAYVTYYNPAVLRACGQTTMPYDLYKDGKWNWDTQYDIIKKVKAKGSTYIPISMQSTDMFMLSAGLDFATYNGSQFTNNLGSVKAGDLMTKAWQQMATINADKAYSGWDTSSVNQGKVGLFTAIAYGLYNEGGWFDNVVGGVANLQAVPVAGPKGKDAYTPIRPKVWGVAKGAKNAEGAAYFLRYYLDTSNCNMSSTFYNKQFETVYNIITKSSAKKTVMIGSGVADYVSSGTYTKVLSAVTAATPANVNTVLNSKKGSIQTGISRANKDLKRMK